LFPRVPPARKRPARMPGRPSLPIGDIDSGGDSDNKSAKADASDDSRDVRDLATALGLTESDPESDREASFGDHGEDREASFEDDGSNGGNADPDPPCFSSSDTGSHGDGSDASAAGDDDDDDDDDGDENGDDHSNDDGPTPPAPPPAVVTEPLAKKSKLTARGAREDRRWRWGGFWLAEVHRKKEGDILIGFGGQCKKHHNNGDRKSHVCKKQITFGTGKTRISEAECLLRVKMWLLLGSSIGDGPHARTHHVRIQNIRTQAVWEAEEVEFLKPDSPEGSDTDSSPEDDAGDDADDHD
jgi:hypothetical protein